MDKHSYTIEAIGVIHSSLTELADAPLQGEEGSYEAWIDIQPEFAEALVGIHQDDRLIVLTWLHRSKRDVLQVHPRGNLDNPLTGVFATRSPDRPNPIGLHPVRVLEINGNSLRVGPIEVIDGTPVVDIKPVLTPSLG